MRVKGESKLGWINCVKVALGWMDGVKLAFVADELQLGLNVSW